MHFLLALFLFSLQVHSQTEMSWWRQKIKNGENPWSDNENSDENTNIGPRCECVKPNECSESGTIMTGEMSLWRSATPQLMCQNNLVCCVPPSTITEQNQISTRNTKPGVVINLQQVHSSSEKPVSSGSSVTVVQAEPHKNEQHLVCGKRAYDTPLKLKVTGTENETKTKLGDFPWMLLMKHEDKEVKQRLGGASLIHPQVALTAAHSVHGKDMTKIIIRAGEHDLDSEVESTTQDAKVKKIIYHPKYIEDPIEHDIAVIILDHPFELNLKVRTICLPPKDSKFSWESCFATGWGSRGNDDPGPRILRKAKVSVIPNDECSRTFLNKLDVDIDIHESFLCAGSNTTADTCLGDGGGPLACRTASSRIFYLAGITSWGLECGEIGIPGGYADVSFVLDFIQNTLKNENIRLNK